MVAGRYRVGALLGSGGMANVYDGMDSRLGRRVAIKLLHPDLATDPAFRLRFRHEAQAAARMSHPTIVRVFDAGEETIEDEAGLEQQLPFIVMERVEGRLLKDVIADGQSSPSEAVALVRQVLTALEYSHRAGVVHRDIKPGNIMVTASGQVKVMDFGIARAISDTSANLATTSKILGTAKYFSPEQARGESVDARSDLYSTGVVLYELLTGKPLFDAQNPVAVAYQHMSETPASASALNPAVSPALNAVLMRALTKDRGERYQSAVDFREELDIALSGKVPDRTVPRDEFTSTLFGVNPSNEGGASSTLRQLSSDEPGAAPRTQSRPPVGWLWAGIAVSLAILVAAVYWVATLAVPQLSEPASVQVPAVVGESWESAEATLNDLGLESQRINESSDSVPEGEVLRTEPIAELRVPLDQNVRVFVSSGLPTVTVPNLSRLTEAAAIEAIESRDLRHGTTSYENSPSVGEGLVMRSDPAVGTDGVRAGDTVDLVVSTGRVEVPDVRGQLVAEASTALRDLQLTIQIQGTDSCAGRRVVFQSLEPGLHEQLSTIVLQYCSAIE